MSDPIKPDNLFAFTILADAGLALLEEASAELFELRTITQEYEHDELHDALHARLTDIGPTSVQSLVRDAIYNLYAHDPRLRILNGEALADAILAPFDRDLEAAREALMEPLPTKAPTPTRERVEVTVACDPRFCWMENRNGAPNVSKITMWSITQSNLMKIEAIGERDKLLRGGLKLTSDVMDKLAIEWLKARYPDHAARIALPRPLANEKAVALLRDAIRTFILDRMDIPILNQEQFVQNLASKTTIAELLEIMILFGYTIQESMQLLLDTLVEDAGELPNMTHFIAQGWPKNA